MKRKERKGAIPFPVRKLTVGDMEARSMLLPLRQETMVGNIGGGGGEHRWREGCLFSPFVVVALGKFVKFIKFTAFKIPLWVVAPELIAGSP